MDADESEVRELLMVPALHDWVYQGDRSKTVNYKANIRAFLKRYVVGKEVDNENYMKCWRDDIFELRVQIEPGRENTRIFGAFAKPDLFVAFHPPKLRSEFGRKSDRRWDRAIERTIKEFDALFQGHHRVRAEPFSNCITANAFDVKKPRS